MAIGQEQAPNNRKKVIAAVVMLLIALGGMYWGYTSTHLSLGATGAKSVWYYDLDKKKLFSGPMGTLPVVMSPSGGQGVRAHVFSCGRCDSQNEADRWIGYLERVPADLAKEWADLYRAGPSAPPDMLRATALQARLKESTQLRPPDGGDDAWVAASSTEASALTAAPRSKCEGGWVVECVYASK